MKNKTRQDKIQFHFSNSSHAAHRSIKVGRVYLAEILPSRCVGERVCAERTIVYGKNKAPSLKTKFGKSWKATVETERRVRILGTFDLVLDRASERAVFHLVDNLIYNPRYQW
jgi:hypothetical protein